MAKTKPAKNKKSRSKRSNAESNPQTIASSKTVVRLANPSQRSSALRRLILDPCNAPLVPGPRSGINSCYVARVRTRYTFHSIAAANTGYFVWFPDYHNSTSAQGIGSVFAFETGTIGSAPLNTVAIPFGSSIGPGFQSAYRLQDPAFPLLNTGIGPAESARTLAACISVIYTGSTVNCSGEIAIATGIDPNTLLNTSAGAPIAPVDVFNLAQTIRRTPENKLEIRHSPTDLNSRWRTGGYPNAASGNFDAVDTPLIIGVPSTNATTMPQLADQPPGIAVAWNALSTSNTNDLVFEITKVIEWRPRAGYNLSAGVTADNSPASFTEAVSNIAHIVSKVVDYAGHFNELMGGNTVGAMRRTLGY